MPTANYALATQCGLVAWYTQQIGKKSSDNPFNWRADSCLSDGADVGLDLTDSYADAGDTVVFGLPLAYSLAVMAWSGVEYKDTYQHIGEWNRFQNILRRGTDWLIKAHSAPNVFWGQIATGELDHQVWVMSEFALYVRQSFQINETHPGSDLAGEAAAALAATSIIFAQDDPAYSALCLAHARELFLFATTFQGKYSDSIPDAAGFYSSSGYADDQLWAAIWLWKATGEQQYKDYVAANSAVLVPKTLTWSLVWDDVSNGNSYFLCKEFGNAAACAQTEAFLNYWAPGGGIPYTPGGLAYLSSWGSLRYPHAIGFIGLTYVKNNLTADSNKIARWTTFAKSQMDYTLGANPLNLSYVVGYGTNWPQAVHNRRSHGSVNNSMFDPAINRHLGYTIVGGPDQNDGYSDVRTNYVQGEYANDMNVVFLSNAIALTARYGGTPRDNFPPAETPTTEFYITGYIASQTSKSVQFNTFLRAYTGYPPRTAAVHFRYFLNITNILKQGLGINDLFFNSYYNEGANITAFVAWKNSTCMYYVEVVYPKGLLYPQSTTTSMKQTQITLRLNYDSTSTTWNSADDWSAQGVGASEQGMNNVPVYEEMNGALVWRWGQEPPAAVYCPVAAPTPSPAPSCSNVAYGTCGGIGYSGPICCPLHYSCVYGNAYYSQCVPS